MKVLIACEYSGRVRDAWLKLGHQAISCDLLPTETNGPHYLGDVQDLLTQEWDVIIAHPPCTRLANSGVRWLHQRDLWDELDEACEFFNLFLDHPCSRVVVENPIPHKYAVERLSRNYDQLIQPWQFGHGETKATCLWLKGLPPLMPTEIVSGREQRIHRASPGPERWKERSRTFTGIASAMAEQWSRCCLQEGAA
ncbi:hypothetical protein [Marinobacterium stanieri]|uniref:DNA (Cytosine-5)-methyltransferase 1 n=1 Tax=Marinobacterium stanieri TaxID=49186 RepID=A0A1N6PDS9_9GAMM|nr:hypothetical protein [Marinobacterium stanieri]SIQ02386.1 hypothetical protein SAMN05421647_101963 [Marinobacterium stanieri]